MSVRSVSLASLVLGGCTPIVQNTGDSIYERFVFDDLREWTFQSADTTVPYRLEAKQAEGFEEIGEEQVYTINFVYDCFNDTGACVDDDLDGVEDIEGQPAFTWKMSSSRRFGIQFHAFDDQVFDPPVVLAEGTMLVDASVESSSGGVDYTGTYLGEEVCPAPGFWPDEDARPDCVRNELVASAEDDPLAGTYWATTRIGFTAFQLQDEPQWQLRAWDVAEEE